MTKDILEEKMTRLITKNQELKKQYENAVADYETAMAEKVELERQLEESKNPLKGIFAQVNDDTLLRACGALQLKVDRYETQQKEFVKYLEDESKEVYRDGGLRQNIFKQILKKYKEIVGVSDEKEN